MAAVAASDPVKVLVKAAAGAAPDALGDFNSFKTPWFFLPSRRTFPTSLKLIDLSEKPQWFLEINPDGKVPVIEFGDGKWIPDSDVTTALIEEKYPDPSLVTPAYFASVGSKVFSSFIKFLKSKDPSDGTEQALVDELHALEEHLKAHGSFISGENISAVDLSLAPKLFHVKLALSHFKGWSIPENFTYIQNYLKLWKKVKTSAYNFPKGQRIKNLDANRELRKLIRSCEALVLAQQLNEG